MNFSFKKFLRHDMRETKWGDIISVWQEWYTNFKKDKAEKILRQKDIDSMTSEELIEYSSFLGNSLFIYEGYTSTRDYLYKEVKYHIERLRNKANLYSYVLIGLPFNLDSYPYTLSWDDGSERFIANTTYGKFGDAYVLMLDQSDQGNWYYTSIYKFDNNLVFRHTNQEGGRYIIFDKLEMVKDTRLFQHHEIEESKTVLNDKEFRRLNDNASEFETTRYFIFSYKFRLIENKTEFLSIYTLKALYERVINNKRKTEIPYFEPNLVFAFNKEGKITEKKWYNDNPPHENTLIFTQKSILIRQNAFNTLKDDLVTIAFGTGHHLDINKDIEDVNNFSFEFSFEDCEEITINSNIFSFRKKIQASQKILKFTEIALIDKNGNCVAYMTTPTIHWHHEMNCSLKIDLLLIDKEEYQ